MVDARYDDYINQTKGNPMITILIHTELHYILIASLVALTILLAADFAGTKISATTIPTDIIAADLLARDDIADLLATRDADELITDLINWAYITDRRLINDLRLIMHDMINNSND
jgi:hypothetical protein